jgi:hypothetical protein
MSIHSKQRIYITFVVLSLLWLLCMGVINLSKVQEIRSLALSKCLEGNFNLFDYCYKKTNDEIHLSFLDYASPFVPAAILLWLSWVFKINVQIDTPVIGSRLIKITRVLAYIIGAAGMFFPFYIVLEKELERIYDVIFKNLFLAPWLAITWISIPLFFRKLLDAEGRIKEFIALHKIIYIVAAAPFLSILLILMREWLRF